MMMLMMMMMTMMMMMMMMIPNGPTQLNSANHLMIWGTVSGVLRNATSSAIDSANGDDDDDDGDDGDNDGDDDDDDDDDESNSDDTRLMETNTSGHHQCWCLV